MKRCWTLGLTALVLATGCRESHGGNGSTASTITDGERTTVGAVEGIAAPGSSPLVPVTEVDASGDTDGVQPKVEVAASCAFDYNEATLAERAWAFDGTLIAISTGDDSRLGGVPTATFAVNHWYKGGAGNEVTIQYEQGPIAEYAPTADRGARLLVTGEPRWGGQPLDDAVAWGCGFTQLWTSTAADQWSRAFGA